MSDSAMSNSLQAFAISLCLKPTLLFSLRDKLRSDKPIAPENFACEPYFSTIRPNSLL